MAEGGESKSLGSDVELEEKRSKTLDDEARMFEAATDYVQQSSSALDKETLLFLYARFKQAKNGPCNTSKPIFFDFKGCEKWTVWNSLGNMTTETAMKEYIGKIGAIEPLWLEETKKNIHNSSTKTNNFGPVMSMMADTEVDIPDDQKTTFDYVKGGDIGKLKESLKVSDLNLRDEMGMALLHWACDRGQLGIVDFLIKIGADVDCRDEDGQTPLHYASACGHLDVLIALLRSGAVRDHADHEGQLPIDVALNDTIQNYLQNDLALSLLADDANTAT